MKTRKCIFEEFFEMGDRYSFDLRDGTHYEGYPLEVFEDYFTFLSGGPSASDDPIEVEFESVDFDKLFYVSFSGNGWKKAGLNSNNNKWEITDC